MSTEKAFEDDTLEALRRKSFPRTAWTERGPVRRRYRTRAAGPGQDALRALEDLARAEGFTGPGREALTGDEAACLEAYKSGRAAEAGMVFGTGTGALWCDLALGTPDGDGWREILVRSERGENLIALASAVGALRFQKL